MIPGRRVRRRAAALLAVLVAGAALAACARAVDGAAHAAPAHDTPHTAAQLEALVVREVPSGLPRVPDDELDPPAGHKRLEDIASYADDPRREQDVLEDYGYRQGWERFWGTEAGPMTSVFVDQFERRAGAVAYAQDLARNDAEAYDGMLSQNPPHLPGGCRQLTVADPGPETGLGGLAAIAWCAHGDFSVCVTAVAGSVDTAVEEVRQVAGQQLDRLPPR